MYFGVRGDFSGMDYRQRIIAAMRELCFQRGFSAVTVDELAARTGISKRTIYRYFRGKEEIIEAVLDEFMQAFSKRIFEALNSYQEPVDKLKAFIKIIPDNIKVINPVALQDLQRHYPHLWEKIDNFRSQRIQELFGTLFTGNKGSFREINPLIFTTALMASVRAVINPSFFMDNNLSPEETFKSLFSIFLYGVVDNGENGDGS